MVDYKTPENLKNYVRKSEEELLSVIRRFPFYTMPKMALLLKRGHKDSAFSKHVSLTSYDKQWLEEHLKNRAFFFKEK